MATAKTKCKSEYINGHKFITLNKPLEYPVYCKKTLAIPAGTRNVKVSFRSSWLTYKTPDGHTEHMNIYISNGVTYHGN